MKDISPLKLILLLNFKRTVTIAPGSSSIMNGLDDAEAATAHVATVEVEATFTAPSKAVTVQTAPP